MNPTVFVYDLFESLKVSNSYTKEVQPYGFQQWSLIWQNIREHPCNSCSNLAVTRFLVERSGLMVSVGNTATGQPRERLLYFEGHDDKYRHNCGDGEIVLVDDECHRRMKGTPEV